MRLRNSVSVNWQVRESIYAQTRKNIRTITNTLWTRRQRRWKLLLLQAEVMSTSTHVKWTGPHKVSMKAVEHHLLSISPKLGRAGYQGCHFSGIAMTSERILMGGLASRGIEASDVIRVQPRRTSRDDKLPPAGANEPTATVIWSQLKSLGLDTREVVLWNAFAFHPHKPGQWLTNRAPTGKEVAGGRPLLEQFLEMYPEATPVAVGRVSQGLLGQMGVTAPAVRHPSMGGASQFREQFAALAGQT